MDWALRLALAPVLITQGLRVRRIAQMLPEAAGPRSGTHGDGPPLHLRIIGDSSGAGVGVDAQESALAGQLAQALSRDFTVRWQVDALTGATTRSTLARLAQASSERADVIVVALGMNDVTRLLPVRLWQRQQHALLSRLRALYAPRHIYLSGVPPVGDVPLLPHPLRWTLGRQAAAFEAAQMRAAAAQQDVSHMPFDMPPDPNYIARDGFHPSAAFYTLWAEKIASRIRADWPTLAG